MSISAIEIANFFISFCNDHGDYLTNLKLQKLLYLAQGWYLAFYNEKLFDEDIEAWVHGPVVPYVYTEFKNFGCKPISIQESGKILGDQIENHLIDVFDYYGGYSGYRLERITHQSDPWKEARGNLPSDEPSNNKISFESMKKYYFKLYKTSSDGH